MKLSIVIPTYRSHDILSLLNDLAQQSLLPFEIIVVENGNTKKMLEQQIQDSELRERITYIHEPLAGLNRARNRGVYASNGSHIAIVDDDCQPDVSWAERFLQAHRENPAAGVIGGRVLLEFGKPPPAWLTSEFRRSLAELDYGEEQRPLARWQHLVGANLSFSRDVFDEVGGFQDSLGLKGGEEIIRANDEAEFIHKASLRGLPGAVYEGRAVVHHRIPESRLKLEYMLRRRYGQGVSDIEYDLLHSGIEKAFQSFYNQVFRSRWHFEELTRDAEGLLAEQKEALLWRGMLARVLYLMGARERLLTREPEYRVFNCQLNAEAVAYERGKKISLLTTDGQYAGMNALLQRVLYDPSFKFSPFLRVALLAGMICQEYDLRLVKHPPVEEPV